MDGSGSLSTNTSDETFYSYDRLGRLNCKEHKVPDGSLTNTKITERTNFKTNTLLKDRISIKIDNPSSKDTTYQFKCDYDNRGNLKTNSLTQSTGTQVNTEHVSFTYDKANRLTSESRKRNDTLLNSTTYTYNKDGSINTETTGSTVKQYNYKKGRLDSVGSSSIINYDNFGNCTLLWLDSPQTCLEMKWERGNLLKEINISGSKNTLVTSSYNIKGVRFKKELPGKTIHYFYDEGKLIAENHDSGYTIKYIYDIEGIKGFVLPHGSYPYYYVKDVLGNVIAIINDDAEVAHYEYDAWGNCTITKDIDGIATLNPIRWKSQYYDQESGLYYMGERYYSPVMKSYISACNINEILYNIDVPGNFNPYAIGNPILFSVNGYNIFTSIPLVPENIGANGESGFWRDLGAIGRFVAGAIITVVGAVLTYVCKPLFKFPVLSIIPQFGISMTMYGLFMMASSWDSQIKADMDRIGWNPFNTNADMSSVNKVSFYKGQLVVFYNLKLSSFSFGIMFLHIDDKKDPDAVNHEWGHFAQLLVLGPLAYAGLAAILSVINYQFGDHNKYVGSISERMYYSKIWERTADWLGGVNRNNYDPFWSWSNFVPW